MGIRKNNILQHKYMMYLHNQMTIQCSHALQFAITGMVLMFPDMALETIKQNPYCATVVLLSEDISASPLCPCNYFGECIFFNMSLANERRQGMLQASSSWLTCIWHNVPCTDRYRVAVCSAGF